jgi:hypothetical protein
MNTHQSAKENATIAKWSIWAHAQGTDSLKAASDAIKHSSTVHAICTTLFKSKGNQRMGQSQHVYATGRKSAPNAT